MVFYLLTHAVSAILQCICVLQAPESCAMNNNDDT
ncbi:hypothetical protein PC116_g13388 [Phytophthora cactorum]|uniref:Uncharacterized protein n=1 Tax=Phytophthora cactorum TaxID=29920 RepID=A0A8T1CGU8_9STRA|nr:hypothetical protein PC114_g11037 [Phytophthora cactorum]KAG2923123.1 hypothetical protein PC115_g9074 [Phytophthora cactorum]KAG3002478.1 hypothetical protein PC120_g19693 [Phytophthora cactorum]KAG3158515.1 hypothetical protein PC128_g21496 [Phytophthora cactorum]KAG4055718.1 hypothetical protein PC123_g9164 [Phytophthora cactorum]